MPEYRAYTVGSDDHIVDVTPLVCLDDDAAIEQANQLVDGCDRPLAGQASRETAGTQSEVKAVHPGATTRKEKGPLSPAE